MVLPPSRFQIGFIDVICVGMLPHNNGDGGAWFLYVHEAPEYIGAENGIVKPVYKDWETIKGWSLFWPF